MCTGYPLQASKADLVSTQSDLLQAVAYEGRIKDCLPAGTGFQPLMTLYLTDSTSAEDVRAAKAAGAVAFKLYPAGATTNSSSGVTDVAKCTAAIEALQEVGLLCSMTLHIAPSELAHCLGTASLRWLLSS